MWPFPKKQESIQKKAATITDIVWPLPENSFMEHVFGTAPLTNAKAMEFYRTNSTVATAVDKIATKVEEIVPVLKTPDNEFIDQHAVLELLQTPNFFDTWKEFMGQYCRNYLLTHDGYFSMLGNVDRPPLEIYAVKPQNIFTTQAKDLLPAAYNVVEGPAPGNYIRSEEPGIRRARYLSGNMREIYHTMGFSSRGTNLQGDSPLEAAALEAKQQIKGRIHNLAVLDNGGRLSLVFSFKDEEGISDELHKDRVKWINEDLGGSANAGKIAILSGGVAEVQEVGKSNKDMDYAELDKVASEAIYKRYEVPLPLVSTDASTYNNVKEALFDFYENTVLPTYSTLAAGLTKSLLPRYDNLPPGTVLTFDPESINVIIRQKIRELIDRKKIGIETIDELRAMLPNRDPLSEGGDILYQAANLVPVGKDPLSIDSMTPEQFASAQEDD